MSLLAILAVFMGGLLAGLIAGLSLMARKSAWRVLKVFGIEGLKKYADSMERKKP